MIAAALVVAALAYLCWPRAGVPAAPAASELFKVEPIAKPAVSSQAAPDSRAAIDSLLEVRDRLAASEQLDEAASAAVDTLWLDLLHGSAKK